MIRLTAGLALVLASALPVLSQTSPAVIATWAESSGPLPPQYAWELTVTFAGDASVTAVYCTYGTGRKTCDEAKETLAPADYDALVAALRPVQEDLIANPVTPMEMPPIGGGTVDLTLALDGAMVALPAFPVEADEARVANARAIVEAAMPEALLSLAVLRAETR